jgi:hypothetical protein
LKKTIALVLALSFAGLLAAVPSVDAKGKRNDDVNPECQVEIEDGGMPVCR